MGSQRPGARRVWTWTRTCGHQDCTERTRYEYERQRDMLESQRRTKGEWLCSRHSSPPDVLSATNIKRVIEAAVRKGTERYPDMPDHFWGGRIGNGWAHGPGFKAWADDFPVGTILRITAEIILPDGAAPPKAGEP